MLAKLATVNQNAKAREYHDSIVDSETVLLAMSAWASKDLVPKILGPTADYVGVEVAGFARKCNVNVGEIFSRAARKLGERLERPGVVSPRVLRGILDDGRFTEDSLSAEYFAGVLASSRSERTNDDRGVPILAVIREMSALQMRMHYVFYELVRRLYAGTSLSLTRRPDASQLLVFIPMRVVVDALMLNADRGILTHCVGGLHRIGLIGDTYAYGKPEFMSPRFPNAPEAGVLLEPTTFGAEVYLWAIGAPDLRVAQFFSRANEGAHIDEVAIPAGAVRAHLQNGVPCTR